MRKTLTLFSLLAIPLFAVRVFDLCFFVDRATGFVDEWVYYIHLGVGLIVVVLGMAVGNGTRRWLRRYGEDIDSTNASLDRSSLPAGFCFFIAGVAVVAASVGILFGMLQRGELPNGIINREFFGIDELARLYFWLLLVSAVQGIFVAFWFMLVGAWYFRGTGRFAGGRFMSVFVALWYYLRVMKDFVRQPVNPKNTTALVMIFGILILSLFYTKYAKAVSVDFPVREQPTLVAFGVMSFLWVFGLGAPTALIIVETGDISEILVLAADVFAAIAALAAVYASLPAKDSMQKDA